MKKRMWNKILVILLLTPAFSWGSLSTSNFEKAKQCLGKRESNNNYKAVNSLGYLGRYQFGAQSLEDIGFIKKGCYKKYKNNVPQKCWTNKESISSKTQFLNSKQAQDKALNIKFNIDYKRLLRSKVLTKESTQVEIGQALFVSHLLGTRGAYNYFKKNINKSDGYGTKASEYSQLAKTCLGE